MKAGDAALRILDDPDHQRAMRSLRSVRRDSQGDVLVHLWFLLDSYRGREQEKAGVMALWQRFLLPEMAHLPTGSLSGIHVPFGDSRPDREKSIYRLAMLGVVADYTVDWRTRSFHVMVANASADAVLDNLRAYLSKYRFADHVEGLLAPLAGATSTAVVSRAVGILVDFVYDEVVAKRKQAIRTMAELCRDFRDSASFRSNLLAYLQDSEFTQELNVWRNRSLEQVGLETVHGVLEKVDAPDQLRRLVGTARRMLDADPGNIALRYLSVGARAMSPWEPDRSVLDETRTLLGSPQISVSEPDALRLRLLQSMERWRPSLARELASEMLGGDEGLRFARRLLSEDTLTEEIRLAAVRRVADNVWDLVTSATGFYHPVLVGDDDDTADL